MAAVEPAVAAAKHVDLVCEGGGVKGIGLAGAYAVLEERGYLPQNVAGTSAGAITAALVAAGSTAEELRDVAFGLDLRQFMDEGWEDRLPLVGRPLSLLRDHGIYEGERFLEWMRDRLAAKGVDTFRRLRTRWDDERWRYRLQVIVSDVTARRLLVLPRDAHRIGLDPDDLEVALVVRMSMSIPLLFEPVRVTNPLTGDEHVLVDGGMLSNFPVWLFDCPPGEDPEWPTFGLLLVEPEPSRTTIGDRLPAPERAPRGARGLVRLLSAMVHTMMEAHDRLYVEQEHWARTIPIQTLGVRTTDFDLGEETKVGLYESGRRAAEEFLERWDFGAYVRAFRRGAPPERRDGIAAALREAS